MLIRQFTDGLELQNDLSIADEVRFMLRPKGTALVLLRQGFLCDKGHSPQAQFNLHTLLLNRLQEATPLFTINFKTRPEDLVGFQFK